MKILRELKSEDNSAKYLIQLDDGNSIETLYMYDKDHKLTYHSTVCVSSQVGCSIGCKFCATGEQGFIRNLQANEILEQVEICDAFRKSQGIIPIDAVVFAGMGEPLLNYAGVRTAIQDIRSRFDIHHFELATVGIVPQIYRLIEDFRDTGIHIRLNLSLHGSSDDGSESAYTFYFNLWGKGNNSSCHRLCQRIQNEGANPIYANKRLK